MTEFIDSLSPMEAVVLIVVSGAPDVLWCCAWLCDNQDKKGSLRNRPF